LVVKQLRIAWLFVILTLAFSWLIAGCRSDEAVAPGPDPARPTAGRGGTGGRAGTGGRGDTPTAGSGGSGQMAGSGGTTAAMDAASERAGNPRSDGGDGAPTDAADSAPDAATDSPALMDGHADAAGPPDTAPDLPRNLATGAPCQQNAQCRTGFCIDGVCCGTACANPCQGCAMGTTGMPDGRCAVRTAVAGMKCGRGCQQFPGQNLLVVVDRVCTADGQCQFPQIPQNPEYCADQDPCTTINCVQDSAYTARCAKTSACTGNTCCCTSGNGRMCMNRSSCTAQGRTCM
jgi:hypothetical protein